MMKKIIVTYAYTHLTELALYKNSVNSILI